MAIGLWKQPVLAYGLRNFLALGETKKMEQTETNIKLLTLAEAATILKISKRTLHRMIQHHNIPAFKVGGQWRILESRFHKWVQEEENAAPKAY
jgi:excisionase family DNA binding protein